MTWEIMRLVRQARNMGASDIHIVAGVPPVLRINGEILPAKAESLTRAEVEALTMSVLSEAQRAHLARERELCATLHDAEAGRVRMTVYYQAGVPEMSLRLVSSRIPEAAALGLPPVVAELARRPSGLVLIAGRNGVGKTTTMNFLVDLINRERRAKIVTIEDPVEFVHQPVKSIIVQQEVGTDVLSFPRALVHVLRQNPDVIVVGEMRELDTIATALNAAETGHLVLATLHTPNVLQAVERLTAVFPAGQQRQITVQFANVLQAVVCQDLIPTIDKSRRVLAAEILLATDAVRSIIREDKAHTLGNVLATGRKQGMQSMDHALVELYQKGVISYDAMATRLREQTMLNSLNSGNAAAPPATQRVGR